MIEDDGPGMRDEELAEYGRRRTTRTGGKVRALRKAAGAGSGTRIEIELPASPQAV